MPRRRSTRCGRRSTGQRWRRRSFHQEAQSLPPRLLTQLQDVLRELVAHYRVSVVFCTATQPAFEAVPGFGEVAGAREIAPEPPELFRRLQRVRYRWHRPGEEVRW